MDERHRHDAVQNDAVSQDAYVAPDEHLGEGVAEELGVRIMLGLQLCKEYTRRYHKRHKCEAHLLYLRRIGYFPPAERREIKKPRGDMGNGCTPFPLAMPDECVVTRPTGGERQCKVTSSTTTRSARSGRRRAAP